ncbi:MAG: hypothetical protein RL392_1732, partial [Pseudomonadota bacterium]
ALGRQGQKFGFNHVKRHLRGESKSGAAPANDGGRTKGGSELVGMCAEQLRAADRLQEAKGCYACSVTDGKVRQGQAPRSLQPMIKMR